jgi:hypothetical protein
MSDYVGLCGSLGSASISAPTYWLLSSRCMIVYSHPDG